MIFLPYGAGFPTEELANVNHCIVWFHNINHWIVWLNNISHCIVRFQNINHCIVRFHNINHGIVWFHNIIHCIVWCLRYYTIDSTPYIPWPFLGEGTELLHSLRTARTFLGKSYLKLVWDSFCSSQRVQRGLRHRKN